VPWNERNALDKRKRFIENWHQPNDSIAGLKGNANRLFNHEYVVSSRCSGLRDHDDGAAISIRSRKDDCSVRKPRYIGSLGIQRVCFDTPQCSRGIDKVQTKFGLRRCSLRRMHESMSPVAVFHMQVITGPMGGARSPGLPRIRRGFNHRGDQQRRGSG
jgi:hypothetical protein